MDNKQLMNRGKLLHEQTLRVDYIQPKKWYDRPTYRLVLPIYFRDIRVPAGFVTDMGTIPRVMWFAFDPVNQYGHAVVVHDYALGVMRRPNADRRFREALREVGVPELRVQAMFNAVLHYGYVAEWVKGLRNRGQ